MTTPNAKPKRGRGQPPKPPHLVRRPLSLRLSQVEEEALAAAHGTARHGLRALVEEFMRGKGQQRT